MTDTDGPFIASWIFWVVSVATLPIVFDGLYAPNTTNVLIPLAAAIAVTTAVFGPVAVLSTLAIFRSPVAIGSTQRFGDSRVFRALRRLAGVKLVPCGCLCHVDLGGVDKPATETLDTTEIWLREYDGAKIRFTSGEQQYVRCSNCGNRYLRTQKDTRSIHSRGDRESMSFWEDDPDPTPGSYPDDGREIMEAEA